MIDGLTGVFPDAVNTNAVDGTDAQLLARREGYWQNETAAATTVAIAESTFFRAERKCRILKIEVILDAAVTGTATNFFTLLIDKRPASAYGTPVNVSSYAADTATTDDAAAFTPKSIGFGTTYGSATSSVFDMAIGDVLTAEVTKAAGGMTFPRGIVYVQVEPRD